VDTNLLVDFSASAQKELCDPLVALLNSQVKESISVLVSCIDRNIFIQCFLQLFRTEW
jgi:hypothetical protein